MSLRIQDVLNWIGIAAGASAALAPMAGLVHSWTYLGPAAGVGVAGLAGARVFFPRRKFGLAERRSLRAYHASEIGRLNARLPLIEAKSHRDHERGLREGHGFIEPDFSVVGEIERGQRIVDVATEALLSEKSIMLLGEPGSGKSLTAGLIFARLADRFSTAPRKVPCPILLHLNTLTSGWPVGHGTLSRAEEQAAWLRKQVAPDVMLPDQRRLARLIAAGRILLICDGLDEIPTMRSPQLLANVLPDELVELFRLPTLLTCRTAFHSIYVDATALTGSFAGSIELLPLRFEEQGVPFLRLYAQGRGTPELADMLIKVMRANPHLKDTVARPLVLRMAAEVLSDLVLDSGSADSYLAVGHGNETSAIYSRYVDKWLQREQGKQAAILNWWQKRDLIDCIAWRIFCKSLASGRGWGHFEIKDLLIEAGELRETASGWLAANMLADCPVDGVCREIAHRSFLIISEDRRRYRFVHKSFFEFCAARHVVRCLDERRTENRSGCAELLRHPLPDEVIDFIRELLSSLRDRQDERKAIEETFIAILTSADINESAGNLMAAQQAANLLPIVASLETMTRLRSGDLRQGHPFLQRAIAVADALHHDRHELLDEFVARMETDREAEAFHMGYNRIYYGDQSFGTG
ncbi:MAG: NACHT domain-containing protein, partial [Actinoallomurus sp.]